MNILEYENYHEDKQHAEVDFPYNTYLCTIPLDFKEVPSHWHDEMEFIYIKKGQGVVSVDFKEYVVTAPSILLILPGQIHAIFQYEEGYMEYENIIFHPNLLLPRQADSSVTNFIRPLLRGGISVPALFTPDFPYFSEIAAPIDACDEICKTKPEGYECFIKGQLFLFLYILEYRCKHPAQKSARRQTVEKLKPIIKYIENHYMDKITIMEISKIAGFSESHFMRYFRETMGTTFIDYLRDYRLTMAARLLTGSDSAILDIAAETGFENLSYFNRMFKKKYGMTPREYRRNG